MTILAACAAEPGPDLDDPADLDDEVALARFEPPSPGAPGIGDPLYPTLGNGGYEVEHYALHLRYETADPAQPLDGTVRIHARATQSLSQFDLDFAGDSVGAVRVDGRRAAFRRDGEDLVITPDRPIRSGQRFVVTVAHFQATPLPPDPRVFDGAPFFTTPDGSGWALQSNNAHRVFPCNDHPSDKASFSFRIDVPAGTTAVASGVQTSVHTSHGRTVYQFEQRAPMATELAQVAVGAFTVIERGRHAGVILRDVVPTRLVGDLEPKLAVVADQLDFMENLVGDYPFPTYGSFVADAPLGFALETQTLTVYDSGFFDAPPTSFGPIMVHELAHQWFGDSVAPSEWSDVWQNEGHAAWYEFSSRFGLDSPQFTSFMQLVYENGDLFRAILGPVAQPPSGDLLALFNQNVYLGGALTLYALRQQVGDPTFRAIERAWVTRFRGRSASTEDFIALASRVSGQDLNAFLHDWLFGTQTPAMPGHPDWTVTPFPPSVASPSLATAPELPLPPELRTQLLRRY
ncbi:MAG TPA: M1 family metallopeptidase [Kofleriaceae bacterium]|nr:M1 family metallopeptidase [Kofleriaceae bacterium]